MAVIRELRLSLRIIPVHEGRLQGRSCKESPTVQLPKQRRVRLRKVGRTGSVQLREQGDHVDHGPQPPVGRRGEERVGVLFN